jgi:CHAT domain-containing protein
MIVGNPQPLPDAVPLPGASEEARAVAQRLRRHDWIVDLLVEKNATKQAFLDGDRNRKVLGINCGMYDHLHLAQHAGIFDHGHQAHLYFARSSKTMAPNEYICFDSDIAAAPLQRTRSVVAAACLTAATDPNLSEYLAMGAAFLQAGVGTFIGTLYPLSDKGSSVLVPELYRLHLESDLSWAEALRQAQLQMVGRINTGSPKSLIKPPKNNESKGILSRIFSRPNTPAFSLSHPYHWAAFTVNGKE